jgi:hypothetical protein
MEKVLSNVSQAKILIKKGSKKAQICAKNQAQL